jgi:L-threonylcarbamoyladenylate synthase
VSVTETRVIPVDPSAPEADAIAAAAAIIRAGGLVAFPTETVYGLGADATRAEAAAKIFAAKGRPASDPLIVHLAAVDALSEVAAAVPPLAFALAARFWPGPLTLVLRRSARIPDLVSAGMDTVAVRMPAHPVARALIAAAGVPIAAPSANTFSRPSATSAAHVLADLGGRIDLILDGGPTPIGVESTIVDLLADPPAILRPGGIPLEALRALIPEIALRPRYLATDEGAASAPGQMIKHYSPRAPVRLYTGADLDRVLARMIDDASKAAFDGKRVGILLFAEDRAAFYAIPAAIAELGSESQLEEAASALFAALRDLDERGVDVIFARDPGRAGLGAAIWDRLLRAAEGRAIVV